MILFFAQIGVDREPETGVSNGGIETQPTGSPASPRSGRLSLGAT